MSVEFGSTLKQAPGMSATGIPVPESAVAELGGARNAAVTVRVRKAGSDGDWYTYRTSIGARGSGPIMPFSSANRTASGLVADDELEVSFELDLTPRTIEVPHDLATALTEAGALDALLALSYSKQRAIIEPIETAKAADTRTRRIEKAVSDLST